MLAVTIRGCNKVPADRQRFLQPVKEFAVSERDW